MYVCMYVWYCWAENWGKPPLWLEELERTTETGRLNLTVFRDDVKLKHGMENRSAYV